LAQCPRGEEHQSVLAVQHTSLNAKGKRETKSLLEGMIAPHEVTTLRLNREPNNASMTLAEQFQTS
jgi:hypothetical protein